METIRTVLIAAGVALITVGTLALALPAFEGVLEGKIGVIVLGVIFLVRGIRFSN